MSVFHTEQGNKYQFNSSGEAAQTIELVSGQTYTFSLASSALNHPFKFSETSDGVHAGGVSYNNGVTYTQGTDAFSFVPENGASDLYYYCSFHSGMGGRFGFSITTIQARMNLLWRKILNILLKPLEIMNYIV